MIMRKDLDDLHILRQLAVCLNPPMLVLEQVQEDVAQLLQGQVSCRHVDAPASTCPHPQLPNHSRVLISISALCLRIDVLVQAGLPAERCLSFERRLEILLDAANGLAYLHSRGLVHGELCAADVLLCEGGVVSAVAVTEFAAGPGTSFT